MLVIGLTTGLFGLVLLGVLAVYLYRLFHRNDGHPRMRKNNVAPSNGVLSGIKNNNDGRNLELGAGTEKYEAAVLYNEAAAGTYETPVPAYLVPIEGQEAFYMANRERGAIETYSTLRGNQVYDNKAYAIPVPAYQALGADALLYEGQIYRALHEHGIYVKQNPLYELGETDVDDGYELPVVSAAPNTRRDKTSPNYDTMGEYDESADASSNSTDKSPTALSGSFGFFNQGRQNSNGCLEDDHDNSHGYNA